MKNLFLSEVKEEVAKNVSPQGLFNSEELEKMIGSLPAPLVRYFRYCGFTGRDLPMYLQIVWNEASIKMSSKGRWKKMLCLQYNFAAEPSRLVYMKIWILGFIPFEGRDKYQNGKGNMLIRLLNLFIITDAKGAEMNSSALVTFLAEAPLLPASCLKQYIHWDAIDDYNVRGSASFNNTTVSGIFTFNDEGEYISFTTDDRFQALRDGVNKNIRWSISAGEYKEIDGIKFPTVLTAAWNQPEGYFEYFRGKIDRIIF